MEIGLIIFLIYLPVFCLLLIFLAPQKYPGFSHKDYWISSLGEKNSLSRPIFSFSLILLSFLGIPFMLQLSYLLPHTLSGYFTLGGLIISFLALIMLPIFPMNTFPVIHFINSIILWLSFVSFNLGIVYLALFSYLFPILFIPLGLGLVLVDLVFLLSLILLLKKYPSYQTVTLVQIRKHETSFIIKNAAVLERLVIFLQIGWVFFISIKLINFFR